MTVQPPTLLLTVVALLVLSLYLTKLENELTTTRSLLDKVVQCMRSVGGWNPSNCIEEATGTAWWLKPELNR